ncbi:MAG: hypothetical protein JXA01_09770 [Dehalococcoidia bacterium]|nr:hypothetical protein [Dehalococcoidia bacterium]
MGRHEPGPCITRLGVTADVTAASGHLPTASIHPVSPRAGVDKAANLLDYCRRVRRGGWAVNTGGDWEGCWEIRPPTA